MKASYRIGASLALATVGAIGFTLPRADPSPGPLRAVREARPIIALAKGDADRITRIELTRADEDDPARPRTVVLEKSGTAWRLAAPIRARASASKVEELIDNLKDLEINETIEGGPASYGTYGLTADSALHVVVWTGVAKTADLYFGKSVEPGQLVRVAGTDGVFAIATSGPRHYEGFLYTRSVRGWRETSLFDFEPNRVTQVQVANANGVFTFSRVGRHWAASVQQRDGRGGLGNPRADWPSFDESKVDDLLGMYKSLSADDFGEDGQRPGSGLDEAERSGGVVRIHLNDGTPDRTLRVGNLTQSKNRWAIPGSRWAEIESGDGELYALAPWTANWALADARTFEHPAIGADW